MISEAFLGETYPKAFKIFINGKILNYGSAYNSSDLHTKEKGIVTLTIATIRQVKGHSGYNLNSHSFKVFPEKKTFSFNSFSTGEA